MQNFIKYCFTLSNMGQFFEIHFWDLGVLFMYARITDSNGNIVTIVNWKVVTQEKGQTLDRFIDSNGNIYLERPQSEVIDGIEIINALTIGAESFYQMQGLGISIGRTE
ncbi:hypothetical protein [Nostoc sp.]|uniref:hypothetical protein n=1 Tax=Nostoc sp. TaxID=1180 RepID=UPI002FFB0F88